MVPTEELIVGDTVTAPEFLPVSVATVELYVLDSLIALEPRTVRNDRLKSVI